ncbi:KRAB-A domain-containing protein 2-like isoform X2 [Leptopilina heterotoma]|uniref:KRAB-A domain-containing protein 2-like isoform X2 n=1 Tax=Leptopilina heterotoma TaxID=63436 RepID=UPI001CAA1FC2|nr:KRAB-A domain-containing protein 2-like isoform X2 [Leptopilina heterotoma]
MLKAWMVDNKSNNWSRGCYEVQWQKNSSKHRVLNRSPYEAVFGTRKFDLNNTGLPENILENLRTEEEIFFHKWGKPKRKKIVNLI